MSVKGPSMRRHRDGRYFVKLNGKFITLGRDRRESHGRFDKLMSRWLGNDRQVTEQMIFDVLNDAPEDAEVQPVKVTADAVTVEQMRHGYIAALKKERDLDWQKNNLHRFESALQPLVDLFGRERVADFTPPKLKTVRETLVCSGRNCRNEINRMIRNIVKCFDWGVGDGLCDVNIPLALEKVDPLRRGAVGTKEGREVDEVAPWVLEATIPYLGPVVVDIVRLLDRTGARPSEIMQLTPSMVDKSDPDCWVVIPPKHKTSGKNKVRVIGLDAEAQAILRPYLLRADHTPCFQPREAMAETRRIRREGRQTPLWASHERRYERQRKAKPQRAAGDTYDKDSLRNAIHRAISKANRDRKRDGLPLLPRWTPYQLRHHAATELAIREGEETAQLLLGHSDRAMTQVYLHRTIERVRQAMKRRQEKAG